MPQLFTNHPWQVVHFRAITLTVLFGGSTNNQLLPFLHFQEPSAKSPSSNSRPYSFSSFSPLLCHAVPWNMAKKRGKQWKTSNHPVRLQFCASKHPFGDNLAALGLLVLHPLERCSRIHMHSWNSLYLLSLKHTQNIRISFFTRMSCTANIPHKEKRKTPETSPWKSTRSVQRKGASPRSLPAPQWTPTLLPSPEVRGDLGQTLHLLPSRWSHPWRSVDPGKETRSGASTGTAADGKVKNIPREREHPYASG